MQGLLRSRQDLRVTQTPSGIKSSTAQPASRPAVASCSPWSVSLHTKQRGEAVLSEAQARGSFLIQSVLSTRTAKMKWYYIKSYQLLWLWRMYLKNISCHARMSLRGRGGCQRGESSAAAAAAAAAATPSPPPAASHQAVRQAASYVRPPRYTTQHFTVTQATPPGRDKSPGCHRITVVKVVGLTAEPLLRAPRIAAGSLAASATQHRHSLVNFRILCLAIAGSFRMLARGSAQGAAGLKYSGRTDAKHSSSRSGARW